MYLPFTIRQLKYAVIRFAQARPVGTVANSTKLSQCHVEGAGHGLLLLQEVIMMHRHSYHCARHLKSSNFFTGQSGLLIISADPRAEPGLRVNIQELMIQ